MAIEIFWFGALVIYIVIEQSQKKSSSTRLFDVIAVVPVAAGVAVGCFALLRGLAPLRWHKIVLLIGVALCALISFPFIYEFFDSAS